MLLQKFRCVERNDNGGRNVVDRITDNELHLKSANGNSIVSTSLHHDSGAD